MTPLPQDAPQIGELEKEQPTNVRFLMLTLLALGVGSAYLSRNTTAANTTIAREFGLSEIELGAVLAGFSIGYFCTQVLGGWMGARFGVRFVFPAFALLWSGCAVWTSFATTLGALGWSRLCLGLAQGVMVPCTGQALRAWIPVRTRGTASSIPAVTMQLGGVIATFLTAIMLTSPGWRVAFRLYALTGALWAIGFAVMFRNSPEQHPWTNAAERALTRDDPPPVSAASNAAAAASSPWWRRLGEAVVLFFTSGSLIAISSREFFRAAVVTFMLQWFPKYLQYTRGVNEKQCAYLTGFVVLAFGLGILPGGWMVDRFYKTTGSKWVSRSLFPACAFAGCGICITSSLAVSGPIMTVVLIALGMFMAGSMLPAVWSGVLDIGGRRSGIVLGFSNMMGTTGDALSNLACGRLADLIKLNSWNWNWFLVPIIAYNLLGAVISLLFNPDRPVPENKLRSVE